jgi:hypothetical protein
MSEAIQDYLGSLQCELNGLARNFQALIGIENAESQQVVHDSHERSIPHLGSWKLDRGIKDASPAHSAILEGKFIHALGITLARKEIKLKKRIFPSALVVIQIDEHCAAKAEGVRTGDIVMSIGIISTGFLKGSEIVQLINHTLHLGEKVRLSFICQEEGREPYSIVLEKGHDSHGTKAHEDLPFMSSWRKRTLDAQTDSANSNTGSEETGLRSASTEKSSLKSRTDEDKPGKYV